MHDRITRRVAPDPAGSPAGTAAPTRRELNGVVGYPLVPAVFIAAAVALVVNAVWTDPLWTSVVFGVVLTGLPVYYLAFRRTSAR